MNLRPIKTEILKNHFDLLETIKSYIKKNGEKIKNGDILVISSKIIALSQGRIVDLASVKPSPVAQKMKRSRYGIQKEDPRVTELVLREADVVVPGSMLLTLKDNIFIASAGIDASNAPKDHVILWPKDPWKTAKTIWSSFKKTFGLKKFGVIIADSHCTPLRWGVSGVALSWAGFEGVEDARGQKDIFGKPLVVTRKAVADNITSAALILMGEGNEKIPMVLAHDIPAKFTNRVQGRKREIFIDPRDCLFNGIYSKDFLKKIQKRPKK